MDRHRDPASNAGPKTAYGGEGPSTGLLAGTKHEARASRPPCPERGRPGRESGSAGVPPAITNAGKMPALHRGIGLNAVRESGSAGVSAAIHQRTENPRERGLKFGDGSTPRPGVKRRAEDRLRRRRPVDGPSRWDKTRSAGVSAAMPGARASRPPCPERGRPARKNKCGQDARDPQRNRPQRRPPSSPKSRTRAQPWQSPRVSRKTSTDVVHY